MFVFPVVDVHLADNMTGMIIVLENNLVCKIVSSIGVCTDNEQEIAYYYAEIIENSIKFGRSRGLKMFSWVTLAKAQDLFLGTCYYDVLTNAEELVEKSYEILTKKT